MLIETKDEGQSFKCKFLEYYGDVAENYNEVSLSNISDDIKNVTVTLSDNVNFDL